MLSLVKDSGYDGFRIFPKIPGLDEWFIHIIDDVHVEDIASHILGNNVDRHILVEHGVEDMINIVLKPNVDQFNECSDDDNTDDDDGGKKFDDSGEERPCEI